MWIQEWSNNSTTNKTYWILTKQDRRWRQEEEGMHKLPYRLLSKPLFAISVGTWAKSGLMPPDCIVVFPEV